MQGKKYIGELRQIAREHKGKLRASDVVKFARNPKTALHNVFEWNDGAAAQQWRLHQARNLIRVSVSILPKVDTEFRAFVSLREDRRIPQGGYRSTETVLSNKAMREALIAEALSDLEYWQRKYSQLSEFADVFAAIRRVLRKVKGKTRTTEAMKPARKLSA